MTSTSAAQVERRTRALEPERLSFCWSLHSKLLAQHERATLLRFPSLKYRQDPVAFFREVLGVEPWSKQIEICEAIRDHKRVAVRSGHKIGKSAVAVGIALWFYCSFPDARVIMTSTTSRQVDQILWRELRMMRAKGSRCLSCKAQDPTGMLIPRPCPHSAIIEGEQGELARTGLKSSDFREIVGFTARESEAVAGISGANLLYILDEASGIGDEIFEAIEGNRAGGARALLLGNPTRNEGEFFDAFFSKSRFYKTLTVSSEETPNALAGEDIIPGLAGAEWIAEKADEWGVDSALYKVRVKGVHAIGEEGRIFNLHMIALAEQRWHDTAPAGRLYIGLDPAGDAGTGDETALVPRRGNKMLSLERAKGLTADLHVGRVIEMIARFKLLRETPVVVLDRDGSVGARVFGALRAHLDQHPNAFELVGVRAGEKAKREMRNYALVRDELAASLFLWFRDGGAIVEDTQLEGELHQLEWSVRADGKRMLTPKKELRKKLGRSPDSYDALALSCWEPLSLIDQPASDALSASKSQVNVEGHSEQLMDPYSADQAWR